MGHDYRRFNFVSIAFPVFMSITLFHASVFVPLVGFLSPAPLYFASVFNGRRRGLYIIGLACVATAFLSGVSGALIYLLSTGLMTWALMDGFFNKLSFEKILATASLVPFVTGAAILFLATSTNGQSFVTPVNEWSQLVYGSMMEAYKEVNAEPELVSWLESNKDWFISIFVSVFPSMAVLFIGVMALLNQFIIRMFSLRFGWKAHLETMILSTFNAPDWFIWSFVGGGAAVALFDGAMGVLGLNVLIVSSGVYALQGIAVIHHFFKRSKAPGFVLALGYFLIFSQPLLLGLAVTIGVIDMWADFRKFKQPDNKDNNGLSGPDNSK